MSKKKVIKKLKAVDTRSAQIKCEEMFEILHINHDIGTSAINVLGSEMKKTLKPMTALAEGAVNYFKDRMDDKHTPIMFAVFSLIFSRLLFDPTIGCVTMTKIKKEGEKDNEQKGIIKTNK